MASELPDSRTTDLQTLVRGWEAEEDADGQGGGRSVRRVPSAALFAWRLEMDAEDGCWRVTVLRRIATVQQGA